MMGDPRKYEGGNSDPEGLRDADEDDLGHPGANEDQPPDEELPLNDGEEATEEEDAG